MNIIYWCVCTWNRNISSRQCSRTSSIPNKLHITNQLQLCSSIISQIQPFQPNPWFHMEAQDEKLQSLHICYSSGDSRAVKSLYQPHCYTEHWSIQINVVDWLLFHLAWLKMEIASSKKWMILCLSMLWCASEPHFSLVPAIPWSLTNTIIKTVFKHIWHVDNPFATLVG